jgi:hypothetical protein|tara:strand:+ start:742 stop:960 length:219 start_codon:yes stop_codon:yes gene_type:complete
MITKFLIDRQLTGKKLRVVNAIPIRKTRFVCLTCYEPIFGVIVDLQEDMDIWDFRYHYFVPIFSCHKCAKPI